MKDIIDTGISAVDRINELLLALKNKKEIVSTTRYHEIVQELTKARSSLQLIEMLINREKE